MDTSPVLKGTEVAHIRRATWSAVCQFQGATTDGRPIYVRLGGGELTVRLGPAGGTAEDAVRTAPVFDGDFGDHHEFDISWSQVEEVTGLRCVGPVDDYAYR